MRLYLDTNVIVDILDDRDPSSASLFLRALSCEHTLILSDLLFRELQNIGFHEEGNTIVQELRHNKKVSFVAPTDEELIAARRLPTHAADALHYVLAVRYADALVTRNIKDFPFTGILIRKPEYV